CPVCGPNPTVTELIDYDLFCGLAVEPSPGEQTPRQIRARLDAGEPLLLLDVREPFELDICHLDGAQNIPMSEIGYRWQEIPRDRPVVVFCHTGIRSANLIAALREAGYTSLINLAGGIDAWSREVDSSIARY